MSLFRQLASWLRIGPDEVRPFLLCFSGVFLLMGYMVMARSLRETLYLTHFDVETLPHITAATAVLTVPSALLFSRWLERWSSLAVLRTVTISQGIGLLSPCSGHDFV